MVNQPIGLAWQRKKTQTCWTFFFFFWQSKRGSGWGFSCGPHAWTSPYSMHPAYNAETGLRSSELRPYKTLVKYWWLLTHSGPGYSLNTQDYILAKLQTRLSFHWLRSRPVEACSELHQSVTVLRFSPWPYLKYIWMYSFFIPSCFPLFNQISTCSY